MLKHLLIGAGAGLVANAAVAPVDRLLGRFISNDQRKREKSMREGSPHQIAGIKFGERLMGRKLSSGEEKIAQAAFTTLYGLGWGVLYASVRRSIPGSAKYAGIPFSLGFYLACDGAIAPKLGLTPSVHRVPWQFNAKEYANHAVWTLTAEMIQRLSDRSEGRQLSH